MKRVILNIKCDFNKVPNIDLLMAKEFEKGEELKQQGIMEHLFVNDGRTGAVLIFKNVNVEEAKKIATTFPLFDFFDIEFISAEKLY
ncbi:MULTISPECIES: muconolactone Delta-isomerase family protein [Bacteroidota]|uniref:muconolactone Delta-isomerase family protein n=1 Tax=Bacteroidota TaxID=976 RepID=UPI002FD9A69F